MVMLLTGLSFADLLAMVEHDSVEGLPRDLSVASLHSFERKYGRTPDVLQLAVPNLAGNVKGYMAPPRPLSRVGDRVEADYFQCDFNEKVLQSETGRMQTIKLATHGGAIAAFIAVDVYSGYVVGQLVKSVAKSVERVSATVDVFRSHGHKMRLFAADQGILTQSIFRVIEPDVQKYLRKKKIPYVCGEAHNHDNGLSHSERTVRTLKELIRFAVLYVINNPNFRNLGFSRKQIFKLWGDLFYWALVINNLKPSPHDPERTKYEVFHGHPPDLRDLRLFPIFSVLYVQREGSTVSNQLDTTTRYWQRGLYVGPSLQVKGAIRAAVLTAGNVKIITTTKMKAVSDGGDVSSYPIIQRAVQHMVADSAPSLPQISAAPDIPVSAAAAPAGVSRSSKQTTSVLAGTGGLHIRPKVSHASCAISSDDLLSCRTEVCNFVDWSVHEADRVYYCFSTDQFILVEDDQPDADVELVCADSVDVTCDDECLRAVTVGVPKTFTAALRDPVWGDAARLEFETLTKGTGAIVEVDQAVAWENIRQGAQVLRMFAVYEEKIKDGKLVRKVRLVADGRHHSQHGPTYSPTPSKEELLVLLHVYAALDWDFFHLDEVRAFLNAPKKDPRKIYAKFSGDSSVREMVNAVYGKRDAPRDYHDLVDERLVERLGCERLNMCSCIYVKRDSDGDRAAYIYGYVDDFVIGGNNSDYVREFIDAFRGQTPTTEPVQNPSALLGMELARLRDRRVILVTMCGRIDDLKARFPRAAAKCRNVPMPTTGYIVREIDVEKLSPRKARVLNRDEQLEYMSIVGCLIWIQGIRLDIIFAVLYLSWYTKAPLQHHLDMGYYCIGYLCTTRDLPLVLGGSPDIGAITYIDASHGTAPRGRSITGSATKLHPASGAVSAKAKAQSSLRLASFDSELDGVTTGLKTSSRFSNMFEELGLPVSHPPTLKNDNKAMIEFVKGEGAAKGVRHMELRMWYTREEFRKGKTVFDHTPGASLVADKLTKLGNVTEHRVFVTEIMGLNLLENPEAYFGAAAAEPETLDDF